MTLEDPDDVWKMTSEMKQAVMAYLKLLLLLMMIFRIIM
jgi:hypothetical protein